MLRGEVLGRHPAPLRERIVLRDDRDHLVAEERTQPQALVARRIDQDREIDAAVEPRARTGALVASAVTCTVTRGCLRRNDASSGPSQ